MDTVHVYEIRGTLAFAPQLLSRAAEETRLLVLQRVRNRKAIGETLHQDRAGIDILRDGDDESVFIVFQSVEKRFRFRRFRRHVGGFRQRVVIRLLRRRRPSSHR